jgi:hypothetical protein
MSDGDDHTQDVIPISVVWDDYYEALHTAYNALRETFAESGLTQDELAARLGVDKSLISKRLNGSENLTVKTLSQMGTGMGHRLIIGYQPYESCGMTNYYVPTDVNAGTTTTVTSGVTYSIQVSPSSSGAYTVTGTMPAAGEIKRRA